MIDRASLCKLVGWAFFALASVAQGQVLTKSAIQVDAGNTKVVGQTFAYRLTYNCSNTSGPCIGAQVVDLLPAEVQEISTVPASPTGDVAAINVTPNFGGSGRTRVQFVLINPLPAGNSGDLLINVRFPAGTTPDGTTATNTSDGINLGTTPGTFTTPPVVVTAKAAGTATLSKTLTSSPANLDLPESYRLRISNTTTATGALNLTAIGPVVDTLPPGAVFNGSTPAADCQPGCVGTTPATITWTAPCTVPLAPGANCDITVNVTFPSATFPSGTNVTNTFTTDGTFLGQPPGSLGVGAVTHPVTTFVPAPGVAFAKNMAANTPNPPTLNQTFGYDLQFSNSGNVPLDNLVITDTLPVQMQVSSVTTGNYTNLSPFAAGVGVRVSYEKNTAPGVFTLWGNSPNTTTNTTLTAPPPGLGAGEFLTKIRYEFGQAAVGMGQTTRPVITGQIINPDHAGGPVAFGNVITNCASLSAVFTAGPTNVTPAPACRNFTLSGPFVQLNPAKDNLSGAGPFNPGQNVSFRLRVRSDARSSDPVPLEFLYSADLLPVDLNFVSWTFDDQGTGLPAPQNFTQIPNYAGTGRTLLRWKWNSGSGNLGVNQQVWINIVTSVRNGVVSGTLTNTFDLSSNTPSLGQRCSGTSVTDTQDLDGDGLTNDTLCTANGTAAVAGIAQLISSKQIQGVCDADFTNTSLGTLVGAQLRYQLKVQNVGTVPMQNFVLIDILPGVGDTGVRDTNPRGSQWTPHLTAPIVPPAGTVLYYSTAMNPCRPEVGVTVPGCTAPNWSTVPPTPLSNAKSFKVEFGSRVIGAYDSLSFSFPMVAPATVPAGTFAYNSFAYQADRSDGIGSLAAEPQKVGIQIGTCQAASLGDFVWVDENADGAQNDGPTGLNDVPLTLYDVGADGVIGTPDDVPLMRTLTQNGPSGAAGWYTFAGLTPGTYRVCAYPPPNFLNTIANAAADNVDSDGDPVTHCAPPVTLAPNQNDPTIDFGLERTAALGNYVWFDRNSDGIQNESPSDGANGVTVRLYADNGDGTPNTANDALVATTVTNFDNFGNPGYYEFQELIPGQGYFVQFVRPAAATAFTTRDAGGNDTTDSDANLTNGTTPVVSLLPGEFNGSIDAGLILPTGTLSLGDQVWTDTNNNGIYEPQSGEAGIDNVMLSLYRDVNGNGLPDSDEYSGSTSTFTTSGFAGRYAFKNLAAGTYIVVINGSNAYGALTGLTTATGNDPAPDPDDDVNGDDNGTQIGAITRSLPVTLTAAGEPTSEDGDNNTNLTVDFGFFPSVTPPPLYDYGDAPDAGSGSGPQNYATTALHGGAAHQLVAGGPFLGNCVDADDGTQQNIGANADDANSGSTHLGNCGANGDEDGVSFSGNFIPGTTASFTVTNGSTATCTLNAWVDWNANGVFGDSAGEQIATNVSVAVGSTALTPTVPATARAGTTYARFRCSTQAGLGPTGIAPNGEVEDYVLTVQGQDFGDAPNSYGTQGAGAASHIVSGSNPLRLGQCIDLEADGQPNAVAIGDDLTAGQTFGLCFDDEDGVLFTASVTSCQSTTVSVTASAAGKLDAWFDFNGDGDFADAGEQIFTSQSLTAGSNALSFNVPCAMPPGLKISRFRLSTAGGLASTGTAPDGEVEDYAFQGFGTDFGDAPAPYPTTLAANGANHRVIPGYSLGATIDTESDGQPSVNADGDGADEDGVTFALPGNTLLTCTAQSLNVTLTNGASVSGAKLDAWIDFNGDGDWSDAGERIATATNLVSGSNTVTFNVPCTAITGRTYARFRLSSAGVAAPTGPASEGEVEDYVVNLRGLDLGDAPDPTYPTLIASNGARHRVDAGSSLYLGTCVDVEADGQPNAAASGDDTIGSSLGHAGTCTGNDDEDGIVFSVPLRACHVSPVSVTAGASGVLSAWIDFNGDGDFNDPGEKVASDAAVTAGTQTINVTVPCDATTTPTYARFRLSSQTGLAPTGEAADGEVEDYRVTVQGVDFGDAPDSYGTTIANNGPSHVVDPASSLYLGQCADTEINGVPSLGANGDDTATGASRAGTCAGNDDEDGVVFTSAVTACQAATVNVTAGAAGKLDAWIDFNNDGDFNDAGEQVFASQNLAAGANALSFNVPCSKAGGNLYSRFRLSSAGGLAPTGPADDGEVEDHVISAAEQVDFGDAPDTYHTTFAANGPRHAVGPNSTLFLGACVDGEANAGNPLDGSGDDVGTGGLVAGTCTGNDDEDGVVFQTPLAACTSASVAVTASQAGLLDAWIDFNRNGVFDEPGERIATNQTLAAGVNTLNVNVPCNSVAGATFSRFRVSSGGGLGIGGAAADGEVEDHALTLLATDWGDAPDSYGTTNAANGPRHAVIAGFSLGATIDGEADGQPNATATGDGADEDGITFPISGNTLPTCASPTLTVFLTDAAAIANPRLDAWIDFDSDGSFDATRDRVATGVALVPGVNNVAVNVPCDAKTGLSYARFRLSSGGVSGSGGPALNGEVEDYRVNLQGLDFGDAPDPTYHTLLASDGARHRVDAASTLYLGACVDTEADGAPSANADGDDATAGLGHAGNCTGTDDENGIVFTAPLRACHVAPVSVTAGAPGVLSAWIDFNGDGDFDDPGEKVASDAAVIAGTQSINVTVPCDATTTATYARFRLSSQTGLTPSGEAIDGEVEDYKVTVQGVDFGDAPESYGTTIANNGPTHVVDPASSLYMGQCVDTEVNGVPGVGATGDNLATGASHAGTCGQGGDEDGVVFTTAVTACEAASVTVTAGAAGKLDAWIDYNNDGDFNDAGEQVFANRALVAGANALPFTVPCSKAGGNLYSRFRFSSAGGLGPNGPADDGEVEDHVILGAQQADFGDAPDTYHTTVASNGPRHAVGTGSTLFLGTCVDGEADAAGPLNGTGDDVGTGGIVAGTCAGNDDEDGVTFPTPLAACTTASVSVTASQPGDLDAWIDFNRNGVFDEPSERIATNQTLAAGVNTLSVSVPCATTTAGPSYARFRLSSSGGLGIGGPATDGEVEDHAVTLLTTDWGDAPNTYGTTNASNGPRHAVVPGFNLGATVDGEADGQPSPNADGDGADEDGVAFTDGTQFVACATQNLSVTLTNTAGIANPKLDAWIDFDGDGAFTEPRDRIATSQALVSGANTISVTVPCDIASHATSYARFRLSSTGVLTSGGGVLDGEVEDYLVSTAGQDYGDAPDTYGTTLAANGARHRVLGTNNPTLGVSVDTETVGQPTVGADGDDTHGDDENGATFDASLLPGVPGHVTLTAGSTGGLVDAWIDFDHNGTFDATDRIATSQAIAANGSAIVTYNVPATAVVGATYARVRISTAGGLAPTGAATDGEVEDYLVNVRVGAPSIGLTKRVVQQQLLAPRSNRVVYEIVATNTGNVPLSNVRVTDDLSITFHDAGTFHVVSVSSTDFTLNPGYNGGSDINLLGTGNTLAIGASGHLTMTVDVSVAQVYGPFTNSAHTTADPPVGDPVDDTSQDGTDPDPNHNGDPTDDNVPTVVSFFPPGPIPSLGFVGLVVMAGMLALVGMYRRRKQQQ